MILLGEGEAYRNRRSESFLRLIFLVINNFFMLFVKTRNALNSTSMSVYLYASDMEMEQEGGALVEKK